MWPFDIEKKRVEAFAAAHPVGGLRFPKDPSGLPRLSASKDFVAPTVIDNRGYCTITEDQGETYQCAAFATTSFAENIKWRQTNCPPTYDPALVYKRSKELDGDDGNGTTLDHAAQAFLDTYPDVFDASCKPVLIYCDDNDNKMSNVRYALHRYGCMVGGFTITSTWYNTHGTLIKSGSTQAGGHAVLICGYNENGLIIQNSWGKDWGEKGFAVLSWSNARAQFVYGCVIKGCLKHLDD